MKEEGRTKAQEIAPPAKRKPDSAVTRKKGKEKVPDSVVNKKLSDLCHRDRGGRQGKGKGGK